MARKTQPPQPLCPELARVVDDLAAGRFGDVGDVAPLLAHLRWEADFYLVSHDFPLYCAAQEQVDAVFADPGEWTRRSILSTAGMGKFSTDRTIAEYARDIWGLSPCRRPEPAPDALGRSRSFPNLAQPSSMDALLGGGGAPGSTTFKVHGSASSSQGSLKLLH